LARQPRRVSRRALETVESSSMPGMRHRALATSFGSGARGGATGTDAIYASVSLLIVKRCQPVMPISPLPLATRSITETQRADCRCGGHHATRDRLPPRNVCCRQKAVHGVMARRFSLEGPLIGSFAMIAAAVRATYQAFLSVAGSLGHRRVSPQSCRAARLALTVKLTYSEHPQGRSVSTRICFARDYS
jgi:hypothetical protein